MGYWYGTVYSTTTGEGKGKEKGSSILLLPGKVTVARGPLLTVARCPLRFRLRTCLKTKKVYLDITGTDNLGTVKYLLAQYSI